MKFETIGTWQTWFVKHKGDNKMENMKTYKVLFTKEGQEDLFELKFKKKMELTRVVDYCKKHNYELKHIKIGNLAGEYYAHEYEMSDKEAYIDMKLEVFINMEHKISVVEADLGQIPKGYSLYAQMYLQDCSKHHFTNGCGDYFAPYNTATNQRILRYDLAEAN